MFFEPFKNHGFLLSQLASREIKARYKQSIVGYAWVLINPLAQLAVYTFVFSIIFRFSASNIPYPIFLFAGLLPWTLFSTSISTATNSLVVNAPLLRKIAFPREIIPYAVILSKLVDFLFSTLVFIAFLFIFQVQLSWNAIYVIPLLLLQLTLMTAVSLILSAANLFYRDVQYLANLILMLWMYLTPILYPTSLVPEKYLWLYRLNPMVGIIEGYRAALFDLPFEKTTLWLSVVLSIFIFFLGYIFFKRAERIFADIV